MSGMEAERFHRLDSHLSSSERLHSILKLFLDTLEAERFHRLDSHLRSSERLHPVLELFLDVRHGGREVP